MKPLKDGSQASRILAALVAGETLTPIMALRRFSCMALSQRIGALKRRGHRIDSTPTRVGNKTVAAYTLAGRRK